MTACFPLLLIAPWLVHADIKFRRIPNRALLCLWGMILFCNHNLTCRQELMRYGLALSIISGGVMVNFLTRHSLGMGDIKLIALFALLLGHFDRTLQALVYSSLFGLIWVVATRKRSIPFAPSLLAGALLVMVGL